MSAVNFDLMLQAMIRETKGVFWCRSKPDSLKSHAQLTAGHSNFVSSIRITKSD